MGSCQGRTGLNVNKRKSPVAGVAGLRMTPKLVALEQSEGRVGEKGPDSGS